MRRNVLVTAVAAMLIVGFAAVFTESKPNQNDVTLQARLASATRVAQERGGSGYWLVTSNGAVSTFGTAKFYGSMAGKHLNAPITGIVATADGLGYWLVAKDGGVFSFGDAAFHGSLGHSSLPAPVVGMASSTGAGSSKTGPQGPKGARGDRGATGAKGTQGLRGTTGARGAIGRTGATGATGAIGPIGPRGPAGPIGPRGPAGAVGPAGATGAAGPKGATGAIGASGATGSQGIPGTSGITDIAEFFALMPPDNAATVAPGTAVQFPRNGPSTGGGLITRSSASTFVLSNIATYSVSFVVSVNEPGQLELAVNGSEQAYTVVGRATGTSEIVGESVVTTTSVNSILTIVNPAGESTALTITPLAGGTWPVSATLIIQQAG